MSLVKKLMSDSVLDEISMVDKYTVGLILIKNTYEDCINNIENGSANLEEIKNNIKIISQIYNQVEEHTTKTDEESNARDSLLNYIHSIRPLLFRFFNMKAFW
jgi:hypothetical protein